MPDPTKEGGLDTTYSGWSGAYKQRIEQLEAERDALREALHEIVDVLHASKTGPRSMDEAEMVALAALVTKDAADA